MDQNNILGNTTASQTGGSNKLLQNVSIIDKRELYRSYMPFIKHGGLFIPFNENITPQKISLGQNIFIILTLMDSTKKHPIPGKVVWIQRSGLVKGFGFSFGDTSPARILKEHIETLILDLTLKKETTYTL